MMETISIVLNIISIPLTVISVIATLLSIKYSKQAQSYAEKFEQHKKDILLLNDTLYFERFIVSFQKESGVFLEKTRKSNWYKGIEPNLIISPFKEHLSSFGDVYHLVNGQERLLKEKVHKLNEIIQDYDEANSEQKKQVNSLIIEITEILKKEVIHNRGKIKIST